MNRCALATTGSQIYGQYLTGHDLIWTIRSAQRLGSNHRKHLFSAVLHWINGPDRSREEVRLLPNRDRWSRSKGPKIHPLPTAEPWRRAQNARRRTRWCTVNGPPEPPLPLQQVLTHGRDDTGQEGRSITFVYSDDVSHHGTGRRGRWEETR